MKATIITAALALGVLVFPACTGMASYDTVSYNSMGTAGTLIPGTVVGARNVVIDASDTDKNLGTAAGAAVGAGAGSLLGRGKGRAVSTVGFGIVGAFLGRATAKYATRTQGQVLTIRADGSHKTYSVTQPVFKGIGPIAPGTHGNLRLGGGSQFLPDGY